MALNPKYDMVSLFRDDLQEWVDTPLQDAGIASTNSAEIGGDLASTDTFVVQDASTGFQKTALLSRLAKFATANDVFPSGFPSYGTIANMRGRDDFTHISSGLQGFSTYVSGGTATNSATSYNGRVGVITLSTSTSATGAATVRTNAIVLGAGRHRCRWDIYTPSSLSDGTDTYTLRIGYGDNDTGEHTDGVYFRYTHTESGGNWTCVTRSNGVETKTNTSIAVTTSTWVTLEIEVNAAASSVSFWINGALAATPHTTNIPSGTTRSTAMSSQIVKSAGTTARSLDVDLCYWSFDLTTPI